MNLVDLTISEDIKRPCGKYSEFEKPIIFREAWDHPDPFQEEKWHKAIQEELSDINNCHIWHKVKRALVPSNHHCVKSKWVFKIKRNSGFWAKLVACGYSQIPGVDILVYYSPVVQDITYNLLILAMIKFGLSAKIIDVKTAFLYDDPEEEIKMDCSLGMNDTLSNDAQLLIK